MGMKIHKGRKFSPSKKNATYAHLNAPMVLTTAHSSSTATALVCFGYAQRVDVSMYISLRVLGLETAVGYEGTAAATARYSLPAYPTHVIARPVPERRVL